VSRSSPQFCGAFRRSRNGNAKIRNVIDTVGKKGVLLLGRFTEGRIAVLERLRAELRERGYLPIVSNFNEAGDEGLITSSKVVGCTIGRSAGLAPSRMRPA
jgi:hypothetical protein